MNQQTLFENLCVYDPRNPDYIDPLYRRGDKFGDCYCDNCSQGNHELACEIIRLQDALSIAQR